VDILVPLLFQGTNTEMPPYFMRGQINAWEERNHKYLLHF
jgi:hypothetical protein